MKISGIIFLLGAACLGGMRAQAQISIYSTPSPELSEWVNSRDMVELDKKVVFDMERVN